MMIRRLTVAALAAFFVLAVGAATSAEGTLELRVVSENESTITLGWDPQPGYGYLFSADGVLRSRTNDSSRSTVRFSKSFSTFEVAVIVKGATGSYPPPEPPPPPPPPPPKAACENGLDDDSDGKVDYPADPGCSSLTDTDEVDPVVGGSVFLAANGNDGNACTQAAPCRSMQRGFAVAQAGQTVLLAAGAYPQQNLVNAHKAVAFKASGTVTLAGQLRIECTTGITVDGVSAKNLLVAAGSDNLTVRSSRFGGGSYTAGVEDDPIVIGNVGSCSLGSVSNNVVLDGLHVGPYRYPGGNPGSAHPDCLQFYGGSDGVTIRNSTFEDCEDSFIGAFPDFGDIRNVTIENNTFRKLGDRTYFLSQWGQPGHPGRCEFVTFRGNTFDPDNPNALAPYSTLRTECWDMLVEGNTFLGNGPGDYACSTWAAQWRAVWRNNSFLRGGACVT